MIKSVELAAVTILIKLLRITLGALFLYSGIVKVRHPQQFLSTVYEYQLVGAEIGKMIAIGLPFLEIVLGLSLIIGVNVAGALVCSALLGALFTAATASALRRGLQISCGCFGTSDVDEISAATVIRAGSVCVMALLALVGTLGANTAQRQRQQESSSAGREISEPAETEPAA